MSLAETIHPRAVVGLRVLTDRLSGCLLGQNLMHRQVCEGFSSLDWGNLPPSRAEGRLRLLVLSLEVLGGRTYNRQLEHYTESRGDIDAVHVRIRPGLHVRALARRVGWGRWSIGGMTPTAFWCHTLYRPLRLLLESGRIDAIHATRQGTALAAARLRSHYQFAFSVTADSTVPIFSAMVDRNPRPIDCHEQAIFHAADLIAPYSRWVADSLEKDYSIPERKVQITPPAPPPPWRQETLPNRSHSPLRLLFIGNQSRSKGWSRLLHWHQTRWADRVELHVVSSGVRVDAGARNVVWHGRVSYDKLLKELLPNADLFVLPTRTDTYGQVFVEALCCGVPAVGTRQAAIPEIIDHGITGFTCDRDDDDSYIAAVERSLSDSQLRIRMGAASLARAAEHFDSDRTYNAFLDRVTQTAANLDCVRPPAARRPLQLAAV